MPRARVMVVDDSAVVRRLVSAALARDEALEVVGTAPDGRTALERLPGLRPDVVLLDLEMPEMDGLATLAELRKAWPRLPVIMFSRHTQRGVEATVQALILGANDYVPKPGDGRGVEEVIEGLLIPKVKALAARAAAGGAGEAARPAAGAASGKASAALPRPPVEVVLVGSSTGGPNALAEMLPAFPRDWAVPILIAQHMPAEFTGPLAARLSDRSGLRVREAADGEPVRSAQAWVAPGNHHLVLRGEGQALRVGLDQGPPVNSCRPSVDVLFESAARACGAGCLAVVLTGMGQDGLRGCAAVREAGGQVVVQDEATSVVWSMPGCVAEAGLADAVLPLSQVGPEIVCRVAARRTA